MADLEAKEVGGIVAATIASLAVYLKARRTRVIAREFAQEFFAIKAVEDEKHRETILAEIRRSNDAVVAAIIQGFASSNANTSAVNANTAANIALVLKDYGADVRSIKGAQQRTEEAITELGRVIVQLRLQVAGMS